MPADPPCDLHNSGEDDEEDDEGQTIATSQQQLTTSKRPPRKKFIIVNLSKCRYHIVRQAAKELGWCIEDEGRADVPPDFAKDAFQEATISKVFPSLRYNPELHPQLFWVDTSVLLPRVASLKCFQRLNHFPNMHLICRKMLFFSRCMKLQQRFPTYYTFFPKSFSLKTDGKLLDDYFRSLRGKTKTFVMKPNTGCQGKGILLTRNPIKVAKTLKDQDYIVQLYVHRPLLIESKKFDMRVYVLMTFGDYAQSAAYVASSTVGANGAVIDESDQRFWRNAQGFGGLRLFIHDEGLVRICSEPYCKPNAENLKDVYRHLTNYALNKDNENYEFAGGEEASGDSSDDDGSGGVDLTDEGDGTEGFSGNKRDFRFLERFVNEEIPKVAERRRAATTGDAGKGDDDDTTTPPPDHSPLLTPWEELQRKIDRAVVLTALSAIHEVRQSFHASGAMSGPRIDSRNCFELMGFDILVNEAGNVFVLEVNHSPSLCCDTALDVRVKKNVLKETLRIASEGVPDIRRCGDGGYRKYNEKLNRKKVASRGEESVAPEYYPSTRFRCVFPLPEHSSVDRRKLNAKECEFVEHCASEMEVYRMVWEDSQLAPACPDGCATAGGQAVRAGSNHASSAGKQTAGVGLQKKGSSGGLPPLGSTRRSSQTTSR